MQTKKNDEDYLIHYGVLGMKWGRRKNRNSSNSKKKLTRRQRKANAAKENLVKTAKAYSKREKAMSKYYSDEAARMKNKGANKHDLDYYYRLSKNSENNSQKLNELAKKYGDMNVQGLSKKEVSEKGHKIIKDMGINPFDYTYRIKVK